MSTTEQSTVVERWSRYQRAVASGDASARWEPTDAAGVEALIAHELTDAEINDLMTIQGQRLAQEQKARSSFASELFPMGTYIALSQIESFVTWPERIRELERHTTAQELLAATRQGPGRFSDLWIWTAVNFTLSGRELLINLGEIGPQDQLDDVRTLVDFWRRAALARRGDGTLDNSDAGLVNRYLHQDAVERLLAEVRPIGEDGAALQRLNATLAGYSFLLFTDSRCAICDSGPYPVDGDRVLIVRDYMRLSSGHGYPWAKGLDVPHDSYTVAMVVDRSRLRELEISDWGTTFSEPGLGEAITDVAVIADAPGSWERIEPARFGDLTAEWSRAHMQLYKVFAEMDPVDRTMAATKMYGWGLRPFTDLAGITDRFEWGLADRTLALYPDPLGDTDHAMDLYSQCVRSPDSYRRFDGR